MSVPPDIIYLTNKKGRHTMTLEEYKALVEAQRKASKAEALAKLTGKVVK